MGKGIPDRWKDYTNMGRQIPGTRFIAFKVPLKQAVLNNLDRMEDYFDTRALMDHCSSLGLVIDLTNTDRYYNPKDFLSQEIEYTKLKCEGHIIPKDDYIKKFFSIVEDFLERNKANDKIIGVHCTHGVNRAGYMICRYMIQELGVPPDQAIADFDSARGHVQERFNYLNDLREASWIYKEDEYESQSPLTPRKSRSWKRTVSPYLYPESPVRTRNRSRSKWHRSSSRDRSQYDGINSPSKYRRRSSSLPKYELTPGSSKESERPSRASSKEEMDPSSEVAFKAPKFGKLYYEQCYHGQVLPQYDIDFYRKQKGAVGPSRAPPIPQPPHVKATGRQPPRQYRGPKPYRSPPSTDEPTAEAGSKQDQLFSPELETGRRRSSRRFQPY